MSEVNVALSLELCKGADPRNDVVEFVNENEGVLSAYAAAVTDTAPMGSYVSSPRGDRQEKYSLERVSPPEQRAYYPPSPNHQARSSNEDPDLAYFDAHLQAEIQLDSDLPASLDESDELEQRVSTQLERDYRDKTPELKFPTFGKKLQFDTFRPTPRSHFSSDAMSVWPLRSIEESRLLQHFIQNLASWVRLCLSPHHVPSC